MKAISFKTRLILIAAGLVLFLILLELGMRAGGFVLLSMQEHRNRQALKRADTCRIMCVGESTTQGQYPQFLEQVLNQRGSGVRFSVLDKGVSSTISPVILSHVESYLDEYHPDLVVAMMGINDPKWHIPYERAASSRTIRLFESLRIYKLTRLLWLHILAKTAELHSTEGACRKAIGGDPKNYNACLESGWVYRRQHKFSRAEEAFRKAVEIDPENDTAYVVLGVFYRDQGKFSQAEEAFKKAIEINPGRDNAYTKLGLIYRDQYRLPQAEAVFRKAIDVNPEDDAAYARLGGLYLAQHKFPQAEDLFRHAIDAHPENDQAYFGLGGVYRDQNKFPQAEEAFRKAIDLNPGGDQAYIDLGLVNWTQGKFSEAEEALKNAIGVNPNNDEAYIGLGWVYRDQDKSSQAEDLFKRAIGVNPDSDKAYGAMAVLYGETGNPALAREYARKGNELRSACYQAVTVDNYRKLKAILDKRGIPLVCVQYPMRNVEPLKKIFEHDTGVRFVDNERIFKDALKKASYREYFRDMFGGDFGHCTEKGNRLLAGNIARVILTEVFDN